MADDLVKRLRTRQGNEHQTADLDALEAADRIEELQKHFEHAITIFSLMRDELYVVGEVMKAFPDE